MLNILIVVGILVCAVMALRAPKLLSSALWLAGASALVALLTYLLDAPEIAVIELSVGAGLVTVLFVFAINVAGDEAIPAQRLIPRPLAWILVFLAVALLGWLTLPQLVKVLPVDQSSSFVVTFWQDRSLDALLQVVLIFAGVLGLLGLLTEGKTRPHEMPQPKVQMPEALATKEEK
jgi:uncharacterized MnhB-related membrane protein